MRTAYRKCAVNQCGLPIPDGHAPFQVDVTQGQMEQLGSRFIAGKLGPVLDRFAEMSKGLT